MSNSPIWVLVADERSATICARRDGGSEILREVTPKGASRSAAEGDAKRAFAWELMLELYHGAQNNAYEGVIIVAAEAMLEELRRIALPAVRKSLIAGIVGAPEWSIAQ